MPRYKLIYEFECDTVEEANELVDGVKLEFDQLAGYKHISDALITVNDPDEQSG